jgi:hypothetical protein
LTSIWKSRKIANNPKLATEQTEKLFSFSIFRMLTRLTPRGTSSAAFVKKTRALQLSTCRSLRGRDISVSSEEEEDDDDDDEDDEDDDEKEGDKESDNKADKKKKTNASTSVGSSAAKKNTPPKRKLKTRKPSDANEGKGSDADEETSSRDSSRRPPHLPPPKQQNRKSAETGKATKLRDNRSESRDSSHSKDSGKSGERPTRKTKEAATVYLNVLGQKLTSKKDDNDTISVDSFSGSTQEKRLDEIDDERKKAKAAYVAPIIRKKSNDDSKTADTDDTKSDVDSEKSRKKKSGNKKEGEKKKGKHTLKELQDRLLEEAKLKMGSNPDSPSCSSSAASVQTRNKLEGDSDTGDSEERITISQRTGYIQVD